MRVHGCGYSGHPCVCSWAMAVSRFGLDGGLDQTFGDKGVATANVAVGGKAVELARSVVVQASGKIVGAGPVEHDPSAHGRRG